MASLSRGSPVPNTPPVPTGLSAMPKSPPANGGAITQADDRRRRIAACMPIIEWFIGVGWLDTPFQHGRRNIPDSITTPTPHDINDALADSLNLPKGTFGMRVLESWTWAQLRNFLADLSSGSFEHFQNNLGFQHVQTSENDAGGSSESSYDSQASTLILGGGTSDLEHRQP